MNPLLVTLLHDPARFNPDTPAGDEPLQAVVLNDRPATLTAALQVQLMDLEGKILDQTRFPISLAPYKSSSPFAIPRDMARPQNPATALLYLKLRQDDHILADNSFFFLPDKWIGWPQLWIDCQIEPKDDRQWILQVTSKRFVKDLFISAPVQAEISDNFLDLLPNQPRTLWVQFPEKAPPIPLPFRLVSVPFEDGLSV